MNNRRRLALTLALLLTLGGVLASNPASACITITYDTDWTVSVAGQHFGYQVIRYTSPLSTPEVARFTRYHVLVCGSLILNLDYPPHRRAFICTLILLKLFLLFGWLTCRTSDDAHD